MSYRYDVVPLKILVFCCSGAVTRNRVGTGMAVGLKANLSKQANGAVIRSMESLSPCGTTWVMCFQFVRYPALLQRGEKVRFAVAASQIALFRDHLAWELTEVVDRRSVNHLDGSPQIPLMSLIPLLDSNTLWGRRFAGPTWRPDQANNGSQHRVGLCWASNPKDRTMHAYKSCSPERLLELQRTLLPTSTPISLQTDEADAHQRLQLQPAWPEWCDTLNRIALCDAVLTWIPR